LPLGAWPAGRPGKGWFKGGNADAPYCMVPSPKTPSEKRRGRHESLRRRGVDV